jgi:hypothetical protein
MACTGTSTGVAPDERSATQTPVQVLATGAIISGANGMHFGLDGLLYVASVIGSELVVSCSD